MDTTRLYCHQWTTIEIFPLGLLDIAIIEDDLQIKPGTGDEKYTGTFVACGLEAEDVYKMY